MKSQADQFRELRESTGMSRKDFCKKLGIPYQTMTDWELGHRHAPEYVVRLLKYYVNAECMNRGGKTDRI